MSDEQRNGESQAKRVRWKGMGARLLKLSAVACCLGIASLFIASGLSPELRDQAPKKDSEALERVKDSRAPALSSSVQPRFHSEVDYSEGPAASWWPKTESPILAKATQNGELPGVAERVGPEPMVLRGFEGIGGYGGTWNYVAGSTEEYKYMTFRIGASTLLRWSPHGYPITPNIAKSYEVTDSNRLYTFMLRKGMRWSDGSPFTTEDIRYWWEEEVNDPEIFGYVPEYLMHNGRPPEITIIDETTFTIRYEDPNTLLPEILATAQSAFAERGMFVPSAYMKQFHPTLGDPLAIEKKRRELGLSNARLVYMRLKEWDNPECPRLWPWIYRTYKPDSPMGFVRNPYYYAVDEEGNQLPYIDRVLMTLKTPEMTVLSAANGETSLHFENIRFDNYTQLMEQREENDYRLLHWYAGNASPFLVYPNLNRAVSDADPGVKEKKELLLDRRFRQAMSLAIDREQISRAEFSGLAIPEQLAPVQASPLYEPKLTYANVDFDPAEAKRLLDEVGLVARDSEGYRLLPNGERMHFYLNVPNVGYGNIGQWICEDWKNVGVRVTLREQDIKLFVTQLFGGMHDFTGWNMNGKIYDLIEPKNYVASFGSYYAQHWGRWFSQGGLRGVEPKNPASAYSPPEGHAMLDAMRLTQEARIAPSREKQVELFKQVLGIAAEETWEINIVRQPFVMAVAKNDLRNVPESLFYNWDFMSPFNAGPELFYFENPRSTASELALLEREVIKTTSLPGVEAADEPQGEKSGVGHLLSTVATWALILIPLLLVAYAAFRYRFIGRRLMIMVPTLLVVSICSFVIIQMPKGDYLDSYIAQLQVAGEENYQERIEDLRTLFHMDESPVQQYLRWIGFKWFLSFDASDKGLLQGYLGRSMETLDSVNRLVGERILLTIVVTAVTIVFTWAVALPIGIYSAVNQRSAGDYAATTVGLIGMCIPNFLLALLLILASSKWFGIDVTGLFSPAYATQPEWSWGKIVDLLQRVWVPVVVVGLGGTASMARLMRSNLLDELRRPYVTTARAKGMRPMRLILKYPVRLALTPFVSALGSLFPQLLSGGTIVALVLSLPLVGPQLLNALMKEDMYLAGSLLMILSILGLVGTLISDLLLLWLDPRIRMEGKSR